MYIYVHVVHVAEKGILTEYSLSHTPQYLSHSSLRVSFPAVYALVPTYSIWPCSVHMYSSTVITINVQKQPMKVCIAGSDTCMTTADSCMYIHTYVVSLKMHRMDIAECLHYSGPMMKQCHKYLRIIRFTPQPSAHIHVLNKTTTLTPTCMVPGAISCSIV